MRALLNTGAPPVRETVEDMALRKSVANGGAQWEVSLVLSYHRMKRVFGTESFEDAHKSFHMALLDNAGSPMLDRYCSQLYDLNIRYRHLAAGGANYQNRNIAAEHEEILEAAINGDADAASKALLQHYRLTDEYLPPQLGGL